MIRVFLLTAMCALFSCREAPNEVARKSVGEFVKRNAHDPGSYVPVSYDILREYFPAADTSTEAGRSRYAVHKRDSSYSLVHKYRIKNRMGGTTLTTSTFYFDHDMKVIGYKDL